MPEAPEVEIMTQRLQQWVGNKIKVVDVKTPMDRYLPGDEARQVEGQEIRGIFRRGKFMVFMLERGAILAHNAMSGYWDWSGEDWVFDYVEGRRKNSDKNIRVEFNIAEGGTVRFHDDRKFGFLHYVSPEILAEKLSKLGPEVLLSENTYEPAKYLLGAGELGQIVDRKKPIKEILMNQDYIAGIGNIYAAEALWMAKINPNRMGSDLSSKEVSSLFKACRDVVRRAVDRNLDYASLKIYRRKTCPTCEGLVAAEKIKGRTTYWCTVCQH